MALGWKMGRERGRCGEGQERCVDGHENEQNSATDGGEEVGDKTETRHKGTQESMGVTLAVTHYNGNVEPEEATNPSGATVTNSLTKFSIPNLSCL